MYHNKKFYMKGKACSLIDFFYKVDVKIQKKGMNKSIITFSLKKTC